MMKRGMILFAALCLALSDGLFEYTVLEDGNAMITGYRGSETDLVIPETVGGHPVTGLGNSFDVHTAAVKDIRTITVPETMAAAKAFFLSLGFGRITITTAQEHDRVIAYTSQLAHVLSSAYIKSDTAMSHTGISAGSFRDMTRVATLQPEMWAELCLENRQPMLNELNGLIDRLAQYRDAIQQNDYEKLRQLLHEGSQRKAEVDKLKA